MALQAVPRNGQVAGPIHMVAGQDPQFAQLIAQYASDRQAGLQLIESLQGRIRQLELDLSAARNDNNVYDQEREEQLFAERQERELLAYNLTEARNQILFLTAQLDQRAQQVTALEQRANQSDQLVQSLREETQALSRQVTQEREQIQLLTQQLQAANARGENLQKQVLELQQKIEQQNAQILQHLQNPQQSTLERVAEGIFDLTLRNFLSLFKPSLYKP